MSLVTSSPTVLICSSRCESAHYFAGGVWMERNSSRIAGLLRGNFRLSRWDERRAKIILRSTFWGNWRLNFLPREGREGGEVRRTGISCRNGGVNESSSRLHPITAWPAVGATSSENSPAIYGWVNCPANLRVPSGTKEIVCRP
jgi:hypothetical protein